MRPAPARAAGALSVLLVGDAELAAVARQAFSGSRVPPVLDHSLDVAGAQQRLWAAGAGRQPDLILLDLAVGDGARELLTRLKSDGPRRSIPVLVLYSEPAAAAAFDCYRRQANCCLLRPRDAEGLSSLLRAVGRYWVNGNVLLAPPALAGAAP